MAQVEVAERASGRDVGERIAPRRCTTPCRSSSRASSATPAIDLLLAGARSSPCSAAWPAACARARSPRRVADAVGQRFPALDRDALPVGLRNEPRHRAHRVEVFDDHARVEQARAVVQHQHRHLAQRIVRVDRIVRRPTARPRQHLIFDLLFGERDAHLAHIGTRRRCDQLEHGQAFLREARRKIIASRAPARACATATRRAPASGRALRATLRSPPRASIDCRHDAARRRSRISALTALSPLDGRYARQGRRAARRISANSG